ncbi:MAG: signal peptidase I [Gemmatimonadetes bacterium]|nr:signal peptidase I [Gemmatimonadota bacterium]MYI07059.1 signal peptidase I [Gemmatimonadota bacterium]
MARKRRAKRGASRAGRRSTAKPGGKPRDKDESGEGKKGERPRGGWGETIKTLAIALVIFLVVRFFLIQTFIIDSGSMERTLLVGDLLVVNRAAMGSKIPLTDVRIPGYSEPRRGDVLVFDPPHDDTLILVKRLVGMPGDTLEMRGKVLYLNGEPQDEPYVVWSRPRDTADPEMMWQQRILLGGPRDDYFPTRDNWGPLVIPPERYFMLGDNRDSSLDARVWGLIERWRFEGRVMAIYYSYNRDSMRPFPWIREVRWGRIADVVR